MSKLERPRQSEVVNLARDRRSVHGENDEAARKNLLRKKAR
jgi:hypothetical protein